MTEKPSITAVRRDGKGRNIAFLLTTGQVIDYHQAIALAQNGQLQHVNVFRGRDGDYHLRSDADGDPTNNLDRLPVF